MTLDETVRDPAGKAPADKDRAALAIDCYESAQSRLLPEDFNARIGDGDYVAIGAEFLRLMVDLAELTPDAHVLDIGCGLGRMAQPLRFYLGKEASYTGVDVVHENVDWCVENIRDKAGRFRFFHYDAQHPLYNPDGEIRPEDVALPLKDGAYDFVMMISVFTHLSARMTERYLNEVHRLLRPGGRLFATFFLINERTRAAAGDNHRYPFDLSTPGPVYTPPSDRNYAAAACEERWLHELATRGVGLREVARSQGHWPDLEPAPGTPYQDILVFEK